MQVPWSWVILVVVVLAVIILKQVSQISADDARHLLGSESTVIDVRSPSEYSSDHIPGVINLPLGIVTEEIGGMVPDKDTPIFLHCQSGTRSAMGCQKLKAAGYTQVFNLGSLGRARGLCEAANLK